MSLGFLGTHTPRLDDKGRLILPAKYREQLAEGIVITKGREGCLVVFTTQTWMAKIAARPEPVTRQEREDDRSFFGNASDEVPDKTGRVSIPVALRDYAHLDRDCVVVGANTYLEIWDLARWEAAELARDRAYAEADA